MINPTHKLSLTRQAELLDLSRASLYYEPVGVSEADLKLMRRLDELRLQWPFLGSRMLRDKLRLEGITVGASMLRPDAKDWALQRFTAVPIPAGGIRDIRSTHTCCET